MVLFTGHKGHRYARQPMPKPSVGNGPWGQAIVHLLDQRQLTQADLVRMVNEATITERYQWKAVQPKTVSRIVRGFPTQTRLLGRIAEALGVEFEDVLVAPGRRIANEQRERMAREIATRVLREVDARAGGPDEKSAELASRLTRLSSTRRAELEALISSAEQFEATQDAPVVERPTTNKK